VAPLIQGIDGNFYGTTTVGGIRGDGTVFKIGPSGTLTTLKSFCTISGCADGDIPYGGLVQTTDGDFYGTTWVGGAYGGGNVFKFTPGGAFTTLYSFCSLGEPCIDGLDLYDGLVQAIDGDFYGTTVGGGANGSNDGTVFKITASGTLTTLYSFCSQGAYPYCLDGYFVVSGLVQAANGDFYGTTLYGGTADSGTLFKMKPSGALTTLYSFCSQTNCTDGAGPHGVLVQATDGDLYGTTEYGGAHGEGTVFRITPSGALATLYSFCSQGSPCADGGRPEAGLIQATDGNFYGTTFGCTGCGAEVGSVFQITPAGVLTTLHIFCEQGAPCTEPNSPAAPLLQATDGNFYGTSQLGGTNHEGAIFTLSMGLGPFVAARPALGKVGTLVEILGTDLTGATSVSFNGTAAVFTVVSSSLIAATVPVGASTGKIQVVTPTGTLSSNLPFRVL